MNAIVTTQPTFEYYWNLFPAGDLGPLPVWRPVEGSAIPDPYRLLLVHRRHMTLALKGYHDAEVGLRVLARRREGETYARRSILTTPDGEPILLATVHIDLTAVPDIVREAIVSESQPLGAILKAEKVLRRIDPYAYLEIDPTAGLKKLLEFQGSGPLYGRLATIQCRKVPAIHLLEVAAP